MGRILLALVLLWGLATAAEALCIHHPPRSRVMRARFLRQHACPATGKTTGACLGWRVDHVIPLCLGGPDTTANMQWQSVADAKRKDLEERAACARACATP